MNLKEEARKAASKFIVQAELASYERAKVGRLNGDGSPTIVVPNRTDFIFVTKADSTVTIALNRGAVPLQYGLPIKMRVEAGVYVIQGRDRIREAPGSGDDNDYGVNPHNLTTHTDVTITSPVDNQFLRYNGTEWINETVTAGAVDSVNGQVGAVVLDTDDIAEGATNLWFTAAEETKLAGIAAGAEVNVNADWSAVSGDAQILNKPAIPATFDDLADGTTNKAYTATEKTKLAGIEALADVTDAGNIATAIDGATAKTTPVDADTVPLIDSAASNVLKKVTWANIKATIATYYNSLAATLTNKTLDSTNISTLTAKTTPVDADSAVIVDSAASNVFKRTTYTNIKAFLKTYFDTLYTAINTAVLLTGDQEVAGIKTFTNGIKIGASGDLMAAYDEGVWTPTDGSGAGLSFVANGTYTCSGRQIVAYYNVAFPATANGSAALLAGLPFVPASFAGTTAGGGGIIQVGYTAAPYFVRVRSGASPGIDFALFSTGNALTNAQLSGLTLRGFIFYNT